LQALNNDHAPLCTTQKHTHTHTHKSELFNYSVEITITKEEEEEEEEEEIFKTRVDRGQNHMHVESVTLLPLSTEEQ
jgi:hypothetical protein